ncbi:MAG: hypothetical protein DME60_11245 [Verrucomicrobia bacterium]|nr:MAG: hypothetical protein DME60_11245 [Verrucomicrobiota bacterium]
MNVVVVVVIGGIIGALDGVGIFFAPGEPFKTQIFFAAILKGILVSILTGLSLTSRSAWWQGAGYGLLYGFSFALVIFLAKGGFKSMDAPYVVPSGAILGVVTGLLLIKFAFLEL